jgi:uncharacterized protein
MLPNLVRALLAALPLLALLGCATPSPPAQLYRLPSEAPAAAPAAGAWSGRPWQLVLPVAVPDYLDRDAIVVPQGQAGLRALPGQRWAEPLAEAVPRVLRADLGARLGEGALWAGPLPPGVVATGQLRVELTAFEATPEGGAVRLTARWSLAGAALRGGRSDISVPVATAGVDALVAAHREALWRLSGELAAAMGAAR